MNQSMHGEKPAKPAPPAKGRAPRDADPARRQPAAPDRGRRRRPRPTAVEAPEQAKPAPPTPEPPKPAAEPAPTPEPPSSRKRCRERAGAAGTANASSKEKPPDKLKPDEIAKAVDGRERASPSRAKPSRTYRPTAIAKLIQPKSQSQTSAISNASPNATGTATPQGLPNPTRRSRSASSPPRSTRG